MSPERLMFEVATPLGFIVSTTEERWFLVSRVKHPVMAGHEDDVRAALSEPDQIRRSRRDPSVYLFYRLSGSGRWTCAVAKRHNDEGFLITAYPTDRIKEGELIWNK